MPMGIISHILIQKHRKGLMLAGLKTICTLPELWKSGSLRFQAKTSTQAKIVHTIWNSIYKQVIPLPAYPVVYCLSCHQLENHRG